VCDFQMKCDILLIFHAGWTAAVMVDSYVDNFCSFSLDRLGRFHLKIAYAIGICSTWFHQGHKLKWGKEHLLEFFFFCWFDSLLTCVVYLAFLKDLFVKCRRDIYTWQSFNLNSTPPRINQKKKNKIRWTRENPSGFNIIVEHGAYEKGDYLSVGLNASQYYCIVKYIPSTPIRLSINIAKDRSNGLNNLIIIFLVYDGFGNVWVDSLIDVWVHSEITEMLNWKGNVIRVAWRHLSVSPMSTFIIYSKWKQRLSIRYIHAAPAESVIQTGNPPAV
jgi:hypothetical protein